MNTLWASRPLFRLPPRVVQVSQVVIILAIVLLPISPAIGTLGWHLLHGNSIETRGKKVFVPLTWIAETDNAMNVQMMKLPLTVLRGARFDGMISVGQNFSPLREQQEEIYKSWEALYWNFADDGALVTGPVRMGSGIHETICMESSYPKAPNLASASCLILQGEWRVDFRGDRNDLKVFYEIIRKMN
jgi:hypothetical protein